MRAKVALKYSFKEYCFDYRYDPRFDFVVNDPEDKERDTNFLATVLEQSRLNRIAAIYTALAILFQAVASSPLIESWIRR